MDKFVAFFWSFEIFLEDDLVDLFEFGFRFDVEFCNFRPFDELTFQNTIEDDNFAGIKTKILLNDFLPAEKLEAQEEKVPKYLQLRLQERLKLVRWETEIVLR